ASASTWLLMIARSRALDRLRAQRRRAERTTAAAQAFGEDMVGSGHPAALQPEVPESGAKLLQALDLLPQDQRETLQLAYFSGLSHAEIAEQTGQPLGTIKTRIRLAMQKLRQQLALSWEEAP
ncbi:MAG TPA: sigma-70 family RNA polymerase sigma factor, partial [Gemmatimonadales bacterium]|nr:sigma-70 family RNA polymerase sigma factor [Gemmatimonadales bacterium]